MERYEKFIIKSYKHWDLAVHTNQCYLGRTYLWAKRQDLLDFFEMNVEERKEYFEIGLALKNALKQLFNPDLYNYATLANKNPHLHTHIMPRYKEEREFDGIIFKDERWGKNYVPYNYDFKIPEETLLKLVKEIKTRLTH